MAKFTLFFFYFMIKTNSEFTFQFKFQLHTWKWNRSIRMTEIKFSLCFARWFFILFWIFSAYTLCAVAMKVVICSGFFYFPFKINFHSQLYTIPVFKINMKKSSTEVFDASSLLFLLLFLHFVLFIFSLFIWLSSSQKLEKLNRKRAEEYKSM